MKRFAISAILLASFGVAGIYAEDLSMTAKIPFDFHVRDKRMPAGEYTVSHVNGVLVLSTFDGGVKSARLLTLPATRPAKMRAGTLVFNRYSDTYFLSQVWDIWGSTGDVIRTSALEKEYIAKSGTLETAAILGRRK